MKKAFLAIPFFICLFSFSTGSALGQNKLGINIAARHEEYDKAAKLVGSGGWVVIMASPGNADELKPILASHPEVNIILRGHCPSDPLGPNDEENRKFALSWAATLGGLETAGRKIFFMPWNEPNMTRECQGTGDDYDANNTQCAPHVVKYIGYLRNYLSQSGLLGSKVELLSPMINQHHANYKNFINALGGRTFFENNFYGVSMNLYDNETCGSTPLCHGDSLRNAGKFNDVLSSVGLGGLRAFSVETGIIDTSGTCPPSVTDCPFFDDRRMAGLLSAAYPIWNNAGNFIMFSPLSYNPETNDPSWIYGGTTESFYLKHQVSGQVFKGNSPGSFIGWRDSQGLTTCPNSPSTYVLPGGACGFCAGGGSYTLLTCKPVPADNFGEEYSKEAIKLKETVHREPAPTDAVGSYCSTKMYTGDASASKASIPLVHDLNLYYLGPYVDNLQARVGKTNLDPIKDFGVFEKLAPKGFQDDLKLKFLSHVSGGNSRYQNYNIRGTPASAIAQRFLRIRDKNEALSQSDLSFLKETWAQVPLFANEESEGEIVFEGAGITGSVRTSVPEVDRLKEVTDSIAKMLGAGPPKALAEKAEKAPLADAAVLGEKTSGQVLPACDMGDESPKVSRKETTGGSEQGICTSEDIQVKKTENLTGQRTFDDSIFSGQDMGNCEDKYVNGCCGSDGKCLPNETNYQSNVCTGGYCHCQTCSANDSCHYQNTGYTGCKVKESSHSFDANISIKNRVPYLKAVADNSIEQSGIYRLFLPSSNQDSALQQSFGSVFRDVAGESPATIDLKNLKEKIPQIEVSPSASSDPITLLFYKLGTLVNAKKFISGVVLWPAGQAAALLNPPSTPTTLDYTIDFRNPNIQTTNKEKVIQMVLKNWPNSKIETQWDFVYREAVNHDWNPALVIALWIEESGASGVAFRQDLNREVYDLGCRKGKPNNLKDQLDCLFHKALNTSGSFEAFMCSYSEGKPAGCKFEANPNFPINLKIWYDRLTK